MQTDVRNKVRAGIAGAGVFGNFHAQKYADLEGASLTAIFDCDSDRAAVLARKFGVPAYDDFSKFLDAIDIVSIATPAQTHFSLAREALSAGKHCLVEKPIALDPADAEELNRLAQLRGCVLQVGHQERFVAEAEGLFDDADQIDRIIFNRCCPATGRGEDASVVFDLTIHDLDLARQFDFGEPVRVEARGDEHQVTASLWFAGGRRFDFVSSRRASEANRSMVIETKKGPLRYDFLSRKKEGRFSLVSTNRKPSEKKLTDPLGYGVRRFVDAVRNGTAAAITGDDGLRALEWAQQIEDVRLTTPHYYEYGKEAVA